MIFTVMVAFLDVGGTLWPESWPRLGGDREDQVRRLCSRVQGLADTQATELVDVLADVSHPPSLRQMTGQIVEDALQRCGLTTVVPVRSVIEAMCLPAEGRVKLFPGAARLLRGLAAQARVVILSNTLWRSRAVLQSDFAQFGVAEHVSEYLMSLDFGWRKPHPRFFDAALAVGGASPERCVLIGNSETNDIEPARSRGIVAIRVAIEAPTPSSSTAQYVCASLDEVTDLLEHRPDL